MQLLVEKGTYYNILTRVQVVQLSHFIYVARIHKVTRSKDVELKGMGKQRGMGLMVSMCFFLLRLTVLGFRIDMKRQENIWVLVYTCTALNKLLFEANLKGNNLDKVG